MLGIRHSRGFTLIELMIAVALLSILLLLGVPAFSGYLQNARIRSAAENFYGGIQMARAEAVSRNALVQIMLTNNPPVDDTNLSAISPSTSGANWIVCRTDATSTCTAFIEGKSGTEGSGGSTPAVQVTGSVASVTFNGFGRANTLATFDFSNLTGGACVPAGPMRCLRVAVSLGGQGRMCDPAVDPVASPGDTRAC